MPIRFASPADLPRITEVALAAFGPITWQVTIDRLYGPLNGHDWRERWKQRMEKAFAEQTILVLEEGNAIVGFACGDLNEAFGLAHIDILAVDPAAHGKGYGRTLLQAIEDHFASLGARHVTLESLADNEVANSLYDRSGYQRVAHHVNWFKKLERGPGA